MTIMQTPALGIAPYSHM